MNNWRRRELAGALLIIAGVTAFIGNVVQAGADRNIGCVENATAILRPLNMYVSDYDGTYPPASIWNNPTRLRTELGLYTNDQSVFRCPATGGAPYLMNPSLAGQNYPDSNLKLLEDSVAHADGKKTVGTVGGLVTRGGVEQFVPNIDTVCGNRLSQISIALATYASDYNERYPHPTDDTRFRSLLDPYLRSPLNPYMASPRVWNCPDTGKPYKLGQEFRGKFTTDFPPESKAHIIVATDTQAHRYGFITTSYLDKYAYQQGPRGNIIQLPLYQPMPWPGAVSSGRMSRLGRALRRYAQDHNDTLPPLTDIDSLRISLAPYVNANNFDPELPGGIPYQLNTALGGTKLSSYPNPGRVIWIKDLNNYGGRLISVGYLNGQTDRVAP